MPFPFRICILLLIMLCGTAIAFGQQLPDTTLNEVHVRDTRTPSADIRLSGFSAGQQVQQIDSATLSRYSQQSLATLLTQQLPVFVRSYSFNGLATLGLRGASAAQSQVLWNGIPISNAATGVADLSALPTLMAGNVTMVYGGSAALYGSGNVGGAIVMNTATARFDTNTSTLSVSSGMGSFAQYSGSIRASHSTRKLYLAATAQAQTAQNNYRYTADYGTTNTLDNSRLRNASGMVHAAYKSHTGHKIETMLWWQQYNRQIPPALFEPYSAKQQQDGALRGVASWTFAKGQSTWYARTSLTHDAYRYADTAIGLHTTGGVYQYYQEAGWRHQQGRMRYLLFVPIQYSWLASGQDTQQQRRIALAGAITRNMVGNRLIASAQLRAEQVNATFVWLPGAGISYSVRPWLQLRANAQRTYRVPTLNELYYFPGGNPRLRPEQGWTQDAGYTLQQQHKRWHLQHEGAIFNRQMKDWIMWLGGAVWTPHNIAAVHSRGTETNTRLTYRTATYALHVTAATSYILATTTSSYIAQDGSIGRQIPYTPRYNMRAGLGATAGAWSIDYFHLYTGYRFTTTDESAWLEPYHTGNIIAAWTHRLRQHTLSANLQCNNIWNARYAIAGFRPMPGINWLAGFRLDI